MAVYLQHKQLPKTQTQLYTWLVKIILFQCITDHPEYNSEKKVQCHALGLNLPKIIHLHFIQLSKFAFENIRNQQLIFTDMPEELHDLGFTDSVPELYLPESCSYNFLHLSIQEFLAAYHVSHLSPQEQEQLLLRSREEHHLRNMIRFVAGLTKFEGIRKAAVKKVLEVVEDDHSTGLEKVGKNWIAGTCCLDDYSFELLYEGQDVSILDKEDTYFAGLRWFSLKYHWLALGYCIANSKCAWKLNLIGVHVQMLVQGLHDCKTHPPYTIKHMKWNDYSHPAYTMNIMKWNAYTDKKNTDNYELFTQFPAYFTAHIESIHIAWPWRIRMHHVNVLTRNKLDLSRVLTLISSLKTLTIQRGLKFTLEIVQAFASTLQQNQSLTKLIRSCDINGDHACCLARALHSNTTLTELDMSCNRIHEWGALAMAEMLKHNTTLTVLNMWGNYLGERGAIAMAEMLKHNITLEKLYISYNSVGERGALAMAEMLKHNTTLTVLDMSRNSVGERGALAMAEMLKHNTTLTVLNMSHNSVGEKGALAIAEMLKHNTTLTELNMSNNSVGERGALAIAEMLKHNATLTVLNMSFNSVGERGTLAMAEMLVHNTTLEELNMIDNDIGVEGTRALVESLAVNHHLKTLRISDKFYEAVKVLPAYKKRVFFTGFFIEY